MDAFDTKNLVCAMIQSFNVPIKTMYSGVFRPLKTPQNHPGSCTTFLKPNLLTKANVKIKVEFIRLL